MPQPFPCTVYARKSTDRDDKQMLSIPGQLRELRLLAERRGYRITEELIEACSAREPGRPVFSKLLRDINRGRVNRVIAWKLDRLARNPVDSGALVDALGHGSLLELITPESTYDGKPDSKFTLQIHFASATKMTDDLSVSVLRGSTDLCREGRLPGQPPIGYMKSREGMGFRGAGKVVPDPERFPLVQRFFRDILSGRFTTSQAWARARDAGLTTRPTPKQQSQPVSQTHAYNILGNPFYAGVIRYGTETFSGNHEPILTREEFQSLQLFARRKDAPRPTRNHFLFSGLLHCEECGGTRALVGEEHTTTAGTRHVYYRCGRRKPDSPRCSSKPVRESDLHAATLATLRAITISPDLAAWTLKAVDWYIDQRRGETAASRDALARQLRDTEAKLRRLTDSLLSGVLDAEEYRTLKEELTLQLVAQREAANSSAGADGTWRQRVVELVTQGCNAAEAYSAGDTDTKRSTLARLYANVSVRDRLPLFFLREEYLTLKDVPVVHASLPGSDANLPHPSEVWLNQRKSAATPAKEFAALQRWCTKLEEVRTSVIVSGQ